MKGNELARERGNDKIGSGHLRAMGRLGLAEIRGSLFADSNVAQPTEFGIFGKETPGEVAQLRELNEEPSILGDRMRTLEAGRSDAARDAAKQEALKQNTRESVGERD